MTQGRPTVVLRHETPDRGHHFDWLLAPDDRPETLLLTFRVPRNPAASAEDDSLDAARLPDHRRLYLDYEGPISGNRGHVTRVARGRWLLPSDRSILDGGLFHVLWETGGEPQFWQFDPDRSRLIRVRLQP